jgi:hypothetical protein
MQPSWSFCTFDNPIRMEQRRELTSLVCTYHPLCLRMAIADPFRHALLQQQYMIVRTSLLGSIIVNMLLVLGLAIFTGELQERGQGYNVLATRVAAGLLCLTTVSLLVPVSVEHPLVKATSRTDLRPVHSEGSRGRPLPEARCPHPQQSNIYRTHHHLLYLSLDAEQVKQILVQTVDRIRRR